MRKFCCMAVALGVAAVMTAPAGAQDTSAIIFAGGVQAGAEANAIPEGAATKTQYVNAGEAVSYGEIDWSLRSNYAVDWCTAGNDWRWANQPETTPDYYEQLGHWGYGYGRDLYRFTRGVVRYDVDTFITLGTAMGRTNNLNGALAPFIAQLEYRPDWYGIDPMTTDNQWAWMGSDVNNQVQLGQAPMAYGDITYQWGPGPPSAGVDLVDWCFTGGGLTGKLQLAESTVAYKEWAWNNDPVLNDLLPYYVFHADPAWKLVDNEWGLVEGAVASSPARGDVYLGPGGSGAGGAAGTVLDLEVFYGASENVVYTCQFQGRIYKMTGVKDLGYRRMEDQPQAPSRVTGVVGSAPVYTEYTLTGPVPGPVYGPGVHDNAKPLVGDKPDTYPSSPLSGSGPDPQGPYGVGITATEMFADKTGDRRYVGLAVDAGGRVYAVSQRVMENGAELAPIFASNTGDVWNIDPGVPSGFSLTDTNASFVDPDSVGDVVLISSGSDVNVGQYTVVSVVDAQKVELSADPGAGGQYDAVYKVYEAGQNPKPAVSKCQGSSYDVDRTVLLASDTDGVLANAGTFTLTDANANFLAVGATVSVDDNVAVIDGSPAGAVGSYNITAVTATVLTLETDAGTGSPVSYEVFKDSQAIKSSDVDADVNATALTDGDAAFATVDLVVAGDKCAVIAGPAGVNVGVYDVTVVVSDTQLALSGDAGNSAGAGTVVYEVLDGQAGFALIDNDAATDFVASNVAYGDLVKLGWDGDPNLPNWGSGDYTIRGVSTKQLDLDRDAGDSYSLLISDTYDVFAPGSANWQSEALLDIFQPGGGTPTTVDLNTLVRPDGQTMGGVMISGDGAVSGFMVGGDVEIAPNLVYEVTPPENVTRLWICGVGNPSADPATEDGLDLLVVDVEVDVGGAVVDTRYLGGIDDADLVGGNWYGRGDYNVDGFEPMSMWVQYNDIEFDASGNAVYVGGRGDQDNRYIGMADADVLLAVGNMILEAGLSENAVVGTGARYLDMNYFGFHTDFGVAFDNSAEGLEGLPLRNYGSAYQTVPPPELQSSDPPMDTTLCKIKNNCVWLTFDTAPVLTGGNELLVRTIGTTMGPDLGGLFTCSIDLAFDASGKTLKAKENAVQLVNTTWYRFEPNLLVAVPFAVDLCTLYGNANNDTLTFTTDYGAVKPFIPTFNTDIRQDINGDGLVFTTDYGVIKPFIPTFKPGKPAG